MSEKTLQSQIAALNAQKTFIQSQCDANLSQVDDRIAQLQAQIDKIRNT